MTPAEAHDLSDEAHDLSDEALRSKIAVLCGKKPTYAALPEEKNKREWQYLSDSMKQALRDARESGTEIQRMWVGSCGDVWLTWEGKFQEDTAYRAKPRPWWITPKYCTDRNAMHDALKLLTEPQRSAYLTLLGVITFTADRSRSQAIWGIYNAEPRHQAEAFVIVLTMEEE